MRWLFPWFRRRMDFLAYRLAFSAATRMWENGDSGFVYLLELHLRAMRERDGMPEMLASATELFHSEMEKHTEMAK